MMGQKIPKCHSLLLVSRKSPSLGSVTSAQGLQTLSGVAVQLLHTGWPGSGKEDVPLLVPWCTVVRTQLTLGVQVGDSCKTKSPQGIRHQELCSFSGFWGRVGVSQRWEACRGEVQIA